MIDQAKQLEAAVAAGHAAYDEADRLRALLDDLRGRLRSLQSEADNMGRGARPGSGYEWAARELARLLDAIT